jgi:hypothetical protein
VEPAVLALLVREAADDGKETGRKNKKSRKLTPARRALKAGSSSALRQTAASSGLNKDLNALLIACLDEFRSTPRRSVGREFC